MGYYNSKRCDVIVHGWMIDLELKNEELLIYAFIWQHTWRAKACHWDKLQVDEICKHLNMSRTVVINRLFKLQEKNLITANLEAVNIHE